MKNRIFIILILCLMIIVNQKNVSALSGYNTENQHNISTPKLVTRDLSLSITVAQIMQQYKQGKEILLIDIRPIKEYKKYSIPGSIPLPLHVLKTKGFLKSSNAVLVHQGFQYSKMEKECKNLKQKGYNISILEGGINRWNQLGGAIQGNSLALKNINTISPEIFFAENKYDDILIFKLDQNQSKSDPTLIPHAFELPKQDIIKLISNKIKKSRFNSPRILITTWDGKIDIKTQILLNNSGLPNLFFLNGGIKAYKQFLKQHKTINNTHGITKTTKKGCQPCQQ